MKTCTEGNDARTLHISMSTGGSEELVGTQDIWAIAQFPLPNTLIA